MWDWGPLEIFRMNGSQSENMMIHEYYRYILTVSSTLHLHLGFAPGQDAQTRGNSHILIVEGDEVVS